MSGDATVTALQAALAGENAAVFGYGQAAGALRDADLTRARRLLDAHRSRRDRLRALVLDASATPSPAAPEYAVPATPTATAARAVLAGIEERLTAVYADLVSASDGATRALGVTALSESAVRVVEWGGTVPAFPGLPERAAAPAATSAGATASVPAPPTTTP